MPDTLKRTLYPKTVQGPIFLCLSTITLKECDIARSVLVRATRTWKYLIDFGFSTLNGCKRRTLKTKLDDVEEAVYMAMCDKIKRDGKDVPQ